MAAVRLCRLRPRLVAAWCDRARRIAADHSASSNVFSGGLAGALKGCVLALVHHLRDCCFFRYGRKLRGRLACRSKVVAVLTAPDAAIDERLKMNVPVFAPPRHRPALSRTPRRAAVRARAGIRPARVPHAVRLVPREPLCAAPVPNPVRGEGPLQRIDRAYHVAGSQRAHRAHAQDLAFEFLLVPRRHDAVRSRSIVLRTTPASTPSGDASTTTVTECAPASRDLQADAPRSRRGSRVA